MTSLISTTNYPILTQEQELSLFNQYKTHNDLEAAHKLVLHNLGIVHKIAYRFKGYVTDFNDLVQEGVIGLMHAIKEFDPSKGMRLVAYAAHKIKERIAEFCIRNYNIVKLATTHEHRKLFFNRTLLANDENALEKLGISQATKTEFDVRLAAQVNLDEDNSILQLTSNSPTPEESLIEKQDQLAIQKLKDSVTLLNDREQIIILSRYLTEEPRTLQDIGAELGVSLQRVKQLEIRALGKLRDMMK